MAVVITGEVGINHSGSLELALRLVDAIKKAGCDYAKLQKRVPALDVPADQHHIIRETPWGQMTYLRYKERMEFSATEYDVIAGHCKEISLSWFGSAWSVPAAEFLMAYDPAYIKVPSAKLTDNTLIRWVAANHGAARPIISTGMSTMDEIRTAVHLLADEDPIILHCTSTYPCPNGELNLRCITTLQHEFPDFTIGYSGHEVGLATTVAAVALGAQMVERHVTLDRSAWGSDQAASVEPGGLIRMVKDIRNVEAAMGTGVKRLEPGEQPIKAKLRGEPVGTA